jgi:transposase
MIESMKTPLYIRPLIENERSQIQAGLRSKDAFVLRRSQVLLASERGERAPAIASQFGCHRQTVLNIIHGFNRLRTTFPDETLEALQDLLHRSPRDFGLDTSVWTLSLAARISFQQGLTPRLVSGESVRRALKRLGKSWKRAKHWITSPDPQYLLKKTPVIG